MSERFTSQTYRDHLAAEGRDTRSVVDGKKLAHDMAKAGDASRYIAASARLASKIVREAAPTEQGSRGATAYVTPELAIRNNIDNPDSVEGSSLLTNDGRKKFAEHMAGVAALADLEADIKEDRVRDSQGANQG